MLQFGVSAGVLGIKPGMLLIVPRYIGQPPEQRFVKLIMSVGLWQRTHSKPTKTGLDGKSNAVHLFAHVFMVGQSSDVFFW